MSIELLANLFLLLSAVMAVVVLGLFYRYLEGRSRIVAVAGFLAWLLYTGILGYVGIIASHAPPGPAFFLVPVVVFLAVFLLRSPSPKVFASRVPVELLVGLQSFRVFVELALYELYQNRLVPRIMTFEAGNLDILVGLSAPLVVWLYTTRRISTTGMRVWNAVGIILLMNIVARTLLTFFGALKSDIPNVGIGRFPFTYLVGFLAPLALYLHVLVLRSLPRSSHER